MSTLSSSLNSGSTSKAAPEKYKKKRKSEVQLREPPPNPQKKRPAPVTLESSNPKPEKKVGKHQKQKGPADNSKKRGDPTTLTSLQRTMKESLDGARFRIINEELYKADSHNAHEMMQQEPKIFEEYHTGFRHQVQSWPTNPVEHYISVFSSYPKRTLIADLGCGDAALAKSLVPRGISVASFDLVSDKAYVIEADICRHIPLPGSEPLGPEKSFGEGQIVDVVVCALSLMSINWVECLREAWRVLKQGGELHIAEVTSRFSDPEQFQNIVGSIGFRLKSKDDSNTHFVLFEFTKVARPIKSDGEWRKLVSKGNTLKPCEYKRR
ncbi:methyltransferase-domain-containing protein [Panaeolus papilionaceus]|nr:methyltransferase-domain-containing protein [Panaeolus papilionaceus]